MRLGLEVDATAPVKITYAGGTEEVVNREVKIGTWKALVVPCLTDSLIGLSDLAALGSQIYLDNEWGLISNDVNGKTVPVYRSVDGWRVMLDDLALYNCVPEKEQEQTVSEDKPSEDHLNMLRSRLKGAIWWNQTFGRQKKLNHSSKLKESADTTPAHATYLPQERVKDSVCVRGVVLEGSVSDTDILREGRIAMAAKKQTIDALIRDPSTSRKKRRLYTSVREELKVPPTKGSIMHAGRIAISRARIAKCGGTVMEKYIQLHERMGHCNSEAMCRAVSGSCPSWSGSSLSPKQIRKAASEYTCIPCLCAKRRRAGVPQTSRGADPNRLGSTTAKPGAIISMDPVGPITPVARDGWRWFFLVQDVATGYMHVYCTKDKSAATICEITSDVRRFYQEWGHKVQVIRTDSEEVFKSAAVDKCFREIGVRHEVSIPYQHWEVSVERSIQTVSRGVSTLLHSQPWLSANAWDSALYHYVDIRNRQPNSSTGNMSPIQLVTGEITDLHTAFQFAFGDLVAVSLPEPSKLWKFDVRRDLGIYIGEQKGTRGGCKILSLETNSVSVRGDCIRVDASGDLLNNYLRARSLLRDPEGSASRVEGAVINFEDDWEQKMLPGKAKRLKVPLFDPEALDVLKNSQLNSTAKRRPSAVRTSERVLRSAARGVTVSADPMGGFMTERYFAGGAKVTVGKALKSEESEEWATSMRDEINQLVNGTQTLVPTAEADLEENRVVIHSTMTLRKKIKQDKILDKYKSRLCACGNELSSQSAETYSPTISALAYSTVHQLAIIDRMKQCIVDTVGAYLYQDYPTDAVPLYLTLPKNVAEVCGYAADTKFRIRKYLYGLPDAGRAYYRAYSQ